MNLSLSQAAPRIASFALCAALCATATYWAVTLQGARRSVPDAVMASPEAASVVQAGMLFGNGEHVNHEIRLLGVLTLGKHAAAIVSVGDDLPHAVGLGGMLANGGKVVEVRSRSIVVERNGARSEVFLPAGSAASIFMR